jgi:hypothetical protein
MNEIDIQAVRETLQKFQDGYLRRDVSLIQDFRELFVPEDDLEVIGTGAIEPGDDEWCLGLDAACDLVQNDWEGWGDLTIDVADARIHVLGDVAWLATTGTVQMDLDPEDVYGDFLSYIQEVAADEDENPRMISSSRAGQGISLAGALHRCAGAPPGGQRRQPERRPALAVPPDPVFVCHHPLPRRAQRLSRGPA